MLSREVEGKVRQIKIKSVSEERLSRAVESSSSLVVRRVSFVTPLQ